MSPSQLHKILQEVPLKMVYTEVVQAEFSVAGNLHLLTITINDCFIGITDRVAGYCLMAKPGGIKQVPCP